LQTLTLSPFQVPILQKSSIQEYLKLASQKATQIFRL
jgi:hypothetical protein